MAADSRVAPVRRVSLCRFCRRELIVEQVRAREESNYLHVVLRCPQHGVVGQGERYLQGYVS